MWSGEEPSPDDACDHRPSWGFHHPPGLQPGCGGHSPAQRRWDDLSTCLHGLPQWYFSSVRTLYEDIYIAGKPDLKHCSYIKWAHKICLFCIFFEKNLPILPQTGLELWIIYCITQVTSWEWPESTGAWWGHSAACVEQATSMSLCPSAPTTHTGLYILPLMAAGCSSRV